MSSPEEPAEGQHSVSDLAADLVEHERLDPRQPREPLELQYFDEFVRSASKLGRDAETVQPQLPLLEAGRYFLNSLLVATLGTATTPVFGSMVQNG